MNADSVVVFSLTRTLERGSERAGRRRQRVRISGQIENALVPGRYFARLLGAARPREHGDLAVQGLRLRDFVVVRHGRARGDRLGERRGRRRGRPGAGAARMS